MMNMKKLDRVDYIVIILGTVIIIICLFNLPGSFAMLIGGIAFFCLGLFGERKTTEGEELT